ncbi:MAG: DUF3866 domain-containing protein [Actinobacteria bacterium HGW-Actinobacteria-1]|jgi:hypothetical protein|nr:MAG: DUF3866 domain-containing protein [Actinobacteria bacterium HGW-Actinobacteria-1]
MRLIWASVTAVEDEREGLQRLAVKLDDGVVGTALLYTSLSAPCAEGDRVLLNSTAVDLSLGTGGLFFVVARGGEGVSLDEPSGGHVMKARYTPLQRDVLAVEEASSPHASVMAGASTLSGMPGVCCGLHSQVLPVAAAIKSHNPALRVAYVMTDGASLPLAFSNLVPEMRAAGLIDCTLTAGQAFGGEYEAVTLHSALLAARHVCRADIAVVALGPGIMGTSTPFGHGGIAQGEAINAVGSLGGRPVAVLRISFADARERHHGVSHHTLAALGTIALTPAQVAVPALAPSRAGLVDKALGTAGVWRRHSRVDVPASALPDTRGIRMHSMGRSPEDDPAFFAAAAAAGSVAAGLCD